MAYVADKGVVSTETDRNSESVRAQILVSISDDRRLSAALGELESTSALLERSVHRNKKQIRATHDEIWRLVGHYCVFQVVLLLAVGQVNVPECRNLWAPFLLSALSSIITFRGICVKYWRIRSLENIVSSEDRTLKVAVKRIYELKQEGSNYFNLSSHRDDYVKPKSRPAVIDYFVVLPLVSFSVIVLASIWQTLCRR
ncbi:hypothetical protein KC19_10G019400 [Ceratodon purpureus]|uniref:Uncharacterized protein n=1 Tax=Ceratodon purpureus TaxID=3225 RepID=A0A8T0GFW6_CERPU|nr:hypothetical protein KC19_10G019400 [Ceratodon purpureus]